MGKSVLILVCHWSSFLLWRWLTQCNGCSFVECQNATIINWFGQSTAGNISLFILDRCFLVPHPPIPSGSFLFKTFHFIIINGTAQYSEALFIELLESIVFGFCCVAISLSLSIYLSLSFSLINAFARKSLCEWNFYLKKVGLRSSSSSYVRNVFYVHNTYIYISYTLYVVGCRHFLFA